MNYTVEEDKGGSKWQHNAIGTVLITREQIEA